MRYIAGILSILGIFGMTSTLSAGPGLCTKCDRIREHNKTHHKNYEYYDDYLDEQEQEPEKKDAPDALQWKYPTHKNGDVKKPVEPPKQAPQWKINLKGDNSKQPCVEVPQWNYPKPKNDQSSAKQPKPSSEWNFSTDNNTNDGD